MISVIVPIYNVEKYVRACIESVINQTYSDLEILLIDDGSTDGGGIICDEYAKRDSRIEVIHKVHGGISDTRNTGLDRAKGELIAFVDGDDFIVPNFLERLYAAMISGGVDIVECWHEIVSEDGAVLTEKCEDKKGSRFITVSQWMTETNLRNFLTVVVWNKLYKRYLWDNVRFPFGRVHEDTATTYKLIYKAGKVLRIYEKLYFYRQRKSSITKSPLNDQKKQDSIFAFTDQASFFEEKGDTGIADFVKAKKCLLLISYYFCVSDKTEKKTYREDVRKIFKNIKGNKAVPAKYKRFIRLFLRCPAIAKSLYKRRKR